MKISKVIQDIHYYDTKFYFEDTFLAGEKNTKLYNTLFLDAPKIFFLLSVALNVFILLLVFLLSFEGEIRDD